ncbi:ABC transporter ATP-binding protein [Clostridium polynesiense]|uniref:ABC transporter ATP-binding protein n=1 Tax=Clostridium polynesiense TaxID=1325933 RepID=UPI00058D9978|nr:ABC transporter ATP-binding protein [Clostridium polynesiense]
MEASVQINKLFFSYGSNPVLKDISINFEKGKFYSIIGPNGSGKTTLLKNISKMLSVVKGTVFIENKDIFKISNKEISKKLAVVPQNINIEYEFTAYDIVLMGRTPFKRRFEDYNEEDKDIAERVMRLTSTWEIKDKLITSLSGGEQQRVIAARALCQDTDIILLDEPTSHLDIQHQLGFLNIFKSLKKDVTVIAVMHDLNLASLYSDEIILVEKGSIIDKGEPSKVITKSNIKRVYDIDVDIIRNTSNGSPYIIPIVNL